ncbi:neural Wiskott-Aldrich syndrome protein-like [Mustela erminea]|uniref:neural Wiskott-Aldrich syndrome protein-like n=1 Tax=Mustela erminea TaxID=36723 RepID=UPI001386D76A|nr:neural Wiskott-Aldrich syndrome protein-like [Mustela erminea]XP_032167097.1 neural Wiskott-Aldrich syndrome protein-like [Mustela erminea]XP_032167098.1 neural Wiskott-Aldrich syndrome protein-like [Mustela erminea]XP_032167099.1 neural Wiskott-Aldrich syndrome protein-like [Mustela erminea]XP_032167100.1 neural Wiskott-Aldrich syndrome protein-like [Mustela erminea]XP_032167101.1 neural Wiskott-Aldrich syndrome protein-like [Mustela erminea]
MEPAPLKLPATPSRESNGRQAHPFLALVPGTPALGEGPRSRVYFGGSQSLSESWRETRPGPTPPGRGSPRAPVPSPPLPSPPGGPYLWRRAAGRRCVSQRPCLLQESRKNHGKEREKSRRPLLALPEREAARGRADGKPGAEGGGGAGRPPPPSATLSGPLRPPPLGMRTSAAHAWNLGACAVVPSKSVCFPLPSGAWEPREWAASCGGGAPYGVGGVSGS